MDELTWRLRLLHLPGFGAARRYRLLQAFGSAKEAWHEPWASLQQHCSLPKPLQSGWEERDRLSAGWQEDLRLAEEERVTLLALGDTDYPSGLLDIGDPPILLYLQGSLTQQDRSRPVAFVGTRHATSYGLAMAEQFARYCAAAQLTVVSGLARGIDTAAHQGALDAGGRTVAIVGSGLSRLYPPENRKLAQAICSQGALLSEFPMAVPPDKQTFPQRNRLIAAFCPRLLLVEAPEKSGAMISCERAEALGRDCFALPGRLDYLSFGGNHKLLHEGKAQLVYEPSQLCSYYEQLPLMACKENPSPTMTQPLAEEETALLQLLPPDELSLDEMAQLTGYPIQKLASLVMRLVLKGALCESRGRRYTKPRSSISWPTPLLP